MSTPKKRIDFFETEEGTEFEQSLVRMVTDSNYNTTATYSANIEKHPDHLISFVEKHKNYINSHPATDPYNYLSNLRLMTRKR